VGPNFIGVHEIIDLQVDIVHEMTDAITERIVTLNGTFLDTPKSVIDRRAWNEYSVGKGLVTEHLAVLDKVYNGVNAEHCKAIETLLKLDPVSEDMITSQLADLE